MIPIIRTLFVATLVIILFSFNLPTENPFIGIYGVSTENPSQIELHINKDGSFYYQDLSLAKETIQVKGTWEIKGQKLNLISAADNSTFHNKWKLNKEGQVIKSRKGMTFYTLQKRK